MTSRLQLGWRRASVVVLTATLAGTMGSVSPAYAGGLDTGFGTDGVANHHSDATVAEGYNGIAAAPGGGTYNVGYTTVPGTTDRAVLVTKTSPDGALDTSFGNDATPTGRAVVNIVPQADFAPGVTGALEVGKGITVDPLGRILVLGEVEAPQTGSNPTDVDAFVLRLHANGRLDTSFGTNGISRISLSDGAGTSTRDAVSWRIFVRSDRRIVFAASQGLDSASPARGDRDIAAVQLRANGALDPTWGDGGISINRKSGNENLRSAILDSKGRFVITSYQNAGAGNQPFIYRFTADGTPDASFGDDGIATANPGGLTGIAEAYGISENAGGYVVSAYGRVGWAPATHLVDALLFRFNEDGSFDPTWGTTLGQPGVTSYFSDPALNLADRHRFHLALPDGRIVGVGHFGEDALITVTLPDGTPDVRFGTNGRLAIDLGATSEQFWGATPVGNGYQVVAAGVSGPTATSAPVLAKVDLTPDASTTTVSLTASSVPYPGSATATVTVAAAGAPTSGDVKVSVGTWSHTVAVPASGHATVSLPKGLAPGSYPVRAEFVGAPGTAASSGTKTLTVTKAAAKTALTLSPGTVKTTTRAKATIKVTATGVPAPLGTVTIYDGTRKLTTKTLTAANKGSISLTLPTLKAGKHTIKATYSGSTSTTGSTAAKTLTVTR